MKITDYPTNKNLGCGNDIRKDFFNVDIHGLNKPDLISDVTKLKELLSNCFKNVINQSVLETEL